MAETEKLWTVKGEWVEGCASPPLCPGYFDSPFPRGSCEGMFLLAISEGKFGSVDLSGLKLVRSFVTPEGFTMSAGMGKWKSVIYVDDKASQERAAALEGLYRAMFGYMGPVLKVKRAGINYTRKLGPKRIKCSFDIPGTLALQMMVLTDRDGRPTSIQNSPMVSGMIYVGSAMVNELNDPDLGRTWSYKGMSATYFEFLSDPKAGGFISTSK